jgi:hypothetical protein
MVISTCKVVSFSNILDNVHIVGRVDSMVVRGERHQNLVSGISLSPRSKIGIKVQR